MDLLDTLRQKILDSRKPKSSVVMLLLVFFGAGLVFVGYQLPGFLIVFTGSLGGFLWFLALDAFWASSVPPKVRYRINISHGRPLFQRRVIAAGLVTIWFIIVVIVGPNLREIEGSISATSAAGGALESPVLGALTVVVFLIAFRMGSSTQREREIEEDVYDDWIARQQEKRAKAKNKGVSKRAKRKKKFIEEVDEVEDFEDFEEIDEDEIPLPPQG